MTQQKHASTSTQEKHYTFDNLEQYPYLTKLKIFSKAKQTAQKQNNWDNFMNKSLNLWVNWFQFTDPEFIFLDVNQKTKKIKIYEKHETSIMSSHLNQRFYRLNYKLNELFNFNQFLECQIKKNFINGAWSPAISYNWNKYNDQNLNINRIIKLGVRSSLKKHLSNNLITNQKQIFISATHNLQDFEWFQQVKTKLFIENRSNYIKPDNKQKNLIERALQLKKSENLVRKSSDILGYNVSLNNTNLGVKLKIAGGYDYFHNYLFNSLTIRCGNFKQFQNFVFEYSLRAGRVFGKNIMENDLMNRNRHKWVDDRSSAFLNPRINLLFKKAQFSLGKVQQFIPYLYLQGWTSKNPKLANRKFELDYGIGIRVSGINLSIDTSLFRIGKNLDNINPGIRLNW